jgi:LysR family transcriptional regulator, nitrogen assimilation regulatory protein
VDLRRLRTFVTVAEQGTVSKAALRLRTAQPALSRQIHDLEDELGIRLFDRVRRRLILTSEGEQLLGDCRTVLGAASSLGERAQQLRRGEGGILRVAATPQTIDGVLAQFLRSYAVRHPNVRIKLSEAVGARLHALLERGEVHMAIALTGLTRAVKGDQSVIETFALSPVDFLAASATSLTLGTRGSVDIARLASHPLLLLDASFYVRQTFDAACRLAGVKPDIFLESSSPQALLSLAEAGHGVAVVPSVLPTRRYRLRIARITHRRKPLRENLAVLWDKRRSLPPYAKDFCESLAAHTREFLPHQLTSS